MISNRLKISLWKASFLLTFCQCPKFGIVHRYRCYIYIEESYSEVKWQFPNSKCMFVFIKAYVRKVFTSLYVSFIA